ncbi:MAG: 23S rRNA (guanosine(2251)-2'-O)-methyltransferase RlmB [Clostridiales bacterium]|jgi:23S rRNA (guanosine2251-2'-O)-methyltransferase|nr:23S rRNA (guanosine(2251)-2'-O)-methyltransferase RlmB [Clostridiales bacterium]
MKNVIFGKNSVFEALISGRQINKIFVQNRLNFIFPENIKKILIKKKVVLQYVSKEKIDGVLKNSNHQGILAFVALYNYFSLDEILNDAKKNVEPAFVLILDGITDVGNFGGIIRTACSAGCHGIVISKNKSVSLGGVVAKTSSGAVEYIKICRVSNISQTIIKLKSLGFWVFGADLEGEKLYFESDFRGDIGIVIGSEGRGITRTVKEKCDFLIRIPMLGNVKSLNASVAAGILMFEALKQRKFDN